MPRRHLKIVSDNTRGPRSAEQHGRPVQQEGRLCPQVAPPNHLGDCLSAPSPLGKARAQFHGLGPDGRVSTIAEGIGYDDNRGGATNRTNNAVPHRAQQLGADRVQRHAPDHQCPRNPGGAPPTGLGQSPSRAGESRRAGWRINLASRGAADYRGSAANTYSARIWRYLSGGSESPRSGAQSPQELARSVLVIDLLIIACGAMSALLIGLSLWAMPSAPATHAPHGAQLHGLRLPVGVRIAVRP